jgi:hypothetical protein
MNIVQEYLKQRKNYDPTPPKPNKTYNKFFGGVVIKNINFYINYPLFGIKLKMVIMRFLLIGNNVNGNIGLKNKN